jgi:hypothetical protein
MPEKKSKRTYGGAAVAAGGAGLATSTSLVARAERASIPRRQAKIDAKLAAKIKHIQRTMPQSAGARRGLPNVGVPGANKKTVRAGPGVAGPKVKPKIAAARSSPPPRHSATGELRNARKAAFRQIHELKASRKIVKPLISTRQGKAWTATALVGAPVSYLGARHQLRENQRHPLAKSWISKATAQQKKERNLAAGYGGAVAGGLGYQGAGFLSRPVDAANEKKIRANPAHQAVQAAHRKKHLPGGALAGDPRYRTYFRSYPKSLPGARLKRVLSWTHTGKAGVAATGAVAAGTGYASLSASRKLQGTHKKPVAKQLVLVTKKDLMSDAELRRRKKLQGTISRTTSTLGLAGVGTLGAGLALKKNPAMLRKIPRYSKLSNKAIQAKGARLGERATHIGILSGGIGGLGGYNFAAYTNAESRKRQMKPVAKSYGHEADMTPYTGEEGVAKAWSPTGDTFDSEARRGKRSKVYEGASLAGAGAGGAAVAHYGTHAVRHAVRATRAYKPVELHEKSVTTRKITRGANKGKMADTAHYKPTKAVKVGRLTREIGATGKAGAKGLAGAAVLGGSLYAHKKIKEGRAGSWQPYAKRLSGDEQSETTSAFGVDHV